MQTPFVLRASALVALMLTFAGRPARAQPPMAEAATDATPDAPDMTKDTGALMVSPDPDKLLTAADALVDSRRLQGGRVAFYQQIPHGEFPTSPAALARPEGR